MRKYAEKRMQEEKELKELVRQVAEGHKNSKAAAEKIQNLKQNIGMTYHLMSQVNPRFRISLEF